MDGLSAKQLESIGLNLEYQPLIPSPTLEERMAFQLQMRQEKTPTTNGMGLSTPTPVPIHDFGQKSLSMPKIGIDITPDFSIGVGLGPQPTGAFDMPVAGRETALSSVLGRGMVVFSKRF